MENSTAIRGLQTDLSYNKIKKLSTSFLAEFHNQKSLDLSGNEIDEVDLTEVENSILASKNLLVVYLKKNPIICNCNILHFIKYIRYQLQNNFFEILVDRLKCAGPENFVGKLIVAVRPIDLFCPLKPTNSSEENCPGKCSCMVRTADQTLLINCSNTHLHEIPELSDLLLSKFESTELDISNNHIKDLSLISSTNVKKIFAQNNKIAKLSLENIPVQLRVIDLSNNHLKEIHLAVLKKINLQLLKLGGNPWKCDCQTHSLHSFLKKNEEIINDLNEVQCGENAKIIYKMTDHDLCFVDPALLAASFLIVFILLLISLGYCYQNRIKRWLFEHNICVDEELDDEDKKFDALILYSDLDEDFGRNQIKSGLHPFTIFQWEIDWVINELVSTQVSSL